MLIACYISEFPSQLPFTYAAGTSTKYHLSACCQEKMSKEAIVMEINRFHTLKLYVCIWKLIYLIYIYSQSDEYSKKIFDTILHLLY